MSEPHSRARHTSSTVDCARDAGNLIAVAQPYGGFVQGRRDDIVRSGENCDAGGLRIEHGAGAQDKLLVGKLSRQFPNRRFGARDSEGDLDGSHSCLMAGPGYFDRLLQGFGANRRNQSRIDYTLEGS